MFKYLDKIPSICKGYFGSKIMLSATSMLLFGFFSCNPDNLLSKQNIPHSFLESKAPKHQSTKAIPPDDKFPLKNKCNHLLGTVSYFKAHHHLGLIEVHQPNEACGPGSKKMGLLFYAARSVKDCGAISLSNQKVELSYLDGTIEQVGTLIEVDGAWLNRLSEDNELTPLFHKGGANRVEARSTPDFTISTASSYGIELLDDANSIGLLKECVDRSRFEDIDHAGFMVIKRMPGSISELVQLVEHLAKNTIQHTDMICAASVAGDRLEPVVDLSKYAAYGYIKHLDYNRYRLIPLGNSAHSVKENQYNTVYMRSVEEPTKVVVTPMLVEKPQASVAVTDVSKKVKQTVDVYAQTEALLVMDKVVAGSSDAQAQTEDVLMPKKIVAGSSDAQVQTEDVLMPKKIVAGSSDAQVQTEDVLMMDKMVAGSSGEDCYDDDSLDQHNLGPNLTLLEENSTDVEDNDPGLLHGEKEASYDKNQNSDDKNQNKDNALDHSDTESNPLEGDDHYKVDAINYNNRAADYYNISAIPHEGSQEA